MSSEPFDVCPHGRVLCGNCRVFTVRQAVLIALASAAAAFFVGMSTARAAILVHEDDGETLQVARTYVGAGNEFNTDGANWCADFVVKVLGADLPVPPSRSARALFNAMYVAGLITDDPQPGDLVFFWRDSPSSWKGHVGLVEKVTPQFIATIEGNVGGKVVRQKYVRGAVPRLLGYGAVR